MRAPVGSWCLAHMRTDIATVRRARVDFVAKGLLKYNLPTNDTQLKGHTTVQGSPFSAICAARARTHRRCFFWFGGAFSSAGCSPARCCRLPAWCLACSSRCTHGLQRRPSRFFSCGFEKLVGGSGSLQAAQQRRVSSPPLLSGAARTRKTPASSCTQARFAETSGVRRVAEMMPA